MASEYTTKLILQMQDEATKQWQMFQNDIEKGAGRIARQFDKIRTIAASAFSIYTVKGFIEASNRAEQVTAGLANALKNVGASYDLEATKNYAMQLERTTTFSHDQIESAQTLLAAYTHLHGDALKPLTQATLDYAATMHIGADESAKLIQRAVEGGTLRGFPQLNTALKGVVDVGQRAAIVFQSIEQAMGGRAIAEAQTTAGQMEQIKNKIKDVQEKFGDLLKSGIAPLLGPLGRLADWFTSAPQWVQSVTLVIGGLTVACVALGVAMGPITLAIIGAAGLVAAFISWTASTIGQKEEIDKLNDSISKMNDLTGTSRDIQLQIYEKMGGLNKEIRDSGEASIHAADGMDKLAQKFREMNGLAPKMNVPAFVSAHGQAAAAFVSAHGQAAAAAAPKVDAHGDSVQYFNQQIADQREALKLLNPAGNAYIALLAKIQLEQARLDSTTERATKAASALALLWTQGIKSMSGKGFESDPAKSMSNDVQKLISQMQIFAEVPLPPILNAADWEAAQKAADALASSAQRVGQAMADAILNKKDVMKSTLKAIADEFINYGEALLYSSEAAAIARDIATFDYAAVAADIATMAIGTGALELARGYVAKMHTGGSFQVVGPPGSEANIRVQAGERGIVQTPQQQRSGMTGGGSTYHFHFNAPVSDEEFVKTSILSTLRKSGQTIDKVYVNKQSTVTVS